MPAANIGLFGQSFAQTLYTAPEAKNAFLAEFSRADYTVNFTYYAVGGTSALKENAPPTLPTGYWWDYDLDQPGPMLTNAVAAINASPNKPNRIIWAQGEADSAFANVSPYRFQCATHSILTALRIACIPTNPNGVGVFLHRIGRRIFDTPWPGVQVVREAQVALDDADPAVFGFDTYDLTLNGDDPRYPGNAGDSHMDSLGNTDMGFRAAQRILLSLAKPGRTAPNISLIERLSPTKIRLAFACYTTIIKPARPSHMVIRAGGSLLSDLEFAWVGDQLEITAPAGIPNGSKLLTPYGDLNVIDRVNLIRDVYRQPLQSTALIIPD